MIAIVASFQVAPFLAVGYTLLAGTIFVSAAVLALDGLRLFSGHAESEQVMHQREYVASVGTAVTSLASVLFVVLIVAITAGAGIAAAAVFVL
jgi:hypothetical protein